MKSLSIAGALALSLSACGGGGSSSSSEAQGLWSGTTTSGQLVSGLMLSDGTFYVLYSAVGNANVIAGVVQGTGTASGGTFLSTDARDFNIASKTVSPATVAATYEVQKTLSGAVRYASGSNAFTSTYNSSWAIQPSLATIAGAYSGSVAVSAGIQSAAFTVAANGALSGTGGGCAFTGSVTPRTDGNAYDVSVTFGASPCLFPGQTFSGVGSINSTTKNLIAAVINPARDNGALFVGAKR